MGIWNYYKRYVEKRVAKEDDARRQEIQDDIRIVLKNNALWLVVGDEAVYKANNSDTAEDIIKKTKEIFNVAKEYKEL